MKLNFLMGTATAATQIEGGDTNNTWYRYSEAGNCVDKSCSIRANDHYNRYKEDIDLMAEMGMEIYRFGIEWSRIEPQRGVYNREAIAHYRDEIEYMLKKNIRPLLTIHHFTNPLWFEDMGGFYNPESIEIFGSLVKIVVESYGDLVNEYITINEPNVYVTNGFVMGIWPPEEKDFFKGMRIFRNLAICHISAYEIIHEERKKRGFTDTKVSFANHLRVFHPNRWYNPIDRLGAMVLEYLFQTMVTDAFCFGRFSPLMGKSYKKGKFYDFFGINYYTRSAVKGFGDGVMNGKEYNDLGWEIYPEGLTLLIRKMHKKYGGEIYITENGTSDRHDAFRAKYLVCHLLAAAFEGSPVTRYYHWTFIDNFEWKEGESSKFGLVELDYENQKRKVRKSGQLYSRIIREKEIPESLLKKYAC